jgi:hypothetical protein
MSEKTNELTETAKVILANPAGKELLQMPYRKWWLT